MLLAVAAAIAVSTAFEGGSLGAVEQPAPDYLRCKVKGQADAHNRNRQANWYYFRLDHLPRREVRIELTDLAGEYDFRPGTHAVTAGTRPVFSYDGSTWKHFADDAVSWNDRAVSLTIRFRPEHPRMWVAHMAPYAAANLARLIALRTPDMRVEAIGRSVHGREIPLLTITDAKTADEHKKVIWLMARQHAWEAGTSWVADGAVRFLLSQDPRAEQLRRTTIFQVLPMFDPDGVAEGQVRFNANGYDNNRNWDAVDPARMPEIAACRRTIFAWLDAGHRIDLFLALHDTESSDYVEGPLEKYGSMARELTARLRAETHFYDPLSPRESMRAPVAAGRAMVHQELFRERGMAAFLMELMVERHPRLGRPRTERDYAEFGASLCQCLAAAAGAR